MSFICCDVEARDMGIWPLSAKGLKLTDDEKLVVNINRYHCRQCGKYHVDMKQAKAQVDAP